MSTTEPNVAPTPTPQRGHTKAWIGIVLALVLVSVGLLVWALSLRSDLDSSEQEVADAQAQVAKAQDSGGTIRETLKGAYDALVADIGSTQSDIATIQQDIEQAKASVQQATENARTAAASASDDVKAQVDEAKANVDVAKGNAQIAADCGQAYLSALGSLFSGESVDTVRQQLQSISADCKAAFSGA